MAIGWGVNDNFSNTNGIESPSPSANFVNWINTNYNPLGFRNYDESVTDRFFAHTFAGLNQTNSGGNLVGATLEYNAQSSGGNSDNDSIVLRFVSGPNGNINDYSAWWAFLGSTEAGATSSSNWNSGDVSYHFLNLGSLASTISNGKGYYPNNISGVIDGPIDTNSNNSTNSLTVTIEAISTNTSSISSVINGTISTNNGWSSPNSNPTISLLSTMQAEGVLDVQIQDDTDVDYLKLNVHYRGDFNSFNPNDVINGFAGDDTLEGLTGDDLLTGDDGNDLLDGGSGNDYLDGGTGNNAFLGNAGFDILDGTSGAFDYADYSNGTSILNLPANGFVSPITFFVPQATVQKSADGSQDQLLGIELVSAAGGVYTSTNTTLNDTIDVSSAPSGVKVDLRAGFGPVLQYIATPSLNWPSLNYTVYGFDNVNGSNFNDILYGSNFGNSFLNGNGGNDLLQEDDQYAVGNDILNGGSGNDTLIAAAGNDILDGGTGTDSMTGGTGDDVYFVNTTLDVVTELLNQGTDLVKSSVTLTLVANVENLTLTGITNINGNGNSLPNIITGNTGNNTLDGKAGNDTVNGGSGNDTLKGSTGNDILIGGTGNDSLIGGLGKDTLTGGAGTDIFDYQVLNHSVLGNSILGDYDIITDYNGIAISSGGQKDKLDAVTTGNLIVSSGNINVGIVNGTPSVINAISSVVGSSSSNVAFTATNYAGTFVVLNDGNPGFNSTFDAIVFLQGYNISATNEVILI